MTSRSILPRVRNRVTRDLRTIRLTRNWPSLLWRELRRRNFPEVRLRNGAEIRAPENVDLAFLFNEIWLEESYCALEGGLAPGAVVVDIGANIGVFAILAATRAPGVKVYAFEPSPSTCRVLRDNIAASGLDNVIVEEKAVADGPGERWLEQQDEWILTKLVDGPTRTTLPVQCVGLDDIWGEHGITTCDLLKLDCEGSEYEVIAGASHETLSSIRRIVAEYHEDDVRSVTVLTDLLAARGFHRITTTRTGPSCGQLTADRS